MKSFQATPVTRALDILGHPRTDSALKFEM